MDTRKEDIAITGVTGVYTGVQNVDLELDNDDVVGGWAIHTVYDKDNYIIASIVVGEAAGSVANYAYILSDAKSEEKIGDTYYWEFDAVMDGQIVTLTARSKYTDIFNTLEANQDKVVELRFDGDYVVGVKTDLDIYSDYKTKPINDEDIYRVELNGDKSVNDALSLQGRTMYARANQDDYGLTFTSDAKAVVIQKENNKVVKTEFDSVSEAIDRLADADKDHDGLQYDGVITAILDDRGVATWVVFNNSASLSTGNDPDYDDDNDGDVRYIGADEVLGTITLDERDYPESIGAWTTAEKNAVEAAARLALASIGYRATGSVSWDGGTGNGDTIKAVDMDSSNPAEITFRIIWD